MSKPLIYEFDYRDDETDASWFRPFRGKAVYVPNDPRGDIRYLVIFTNGRIESVESELAIDTVDMNGTAMTKMEKISMVLMDRKIANMAQYQKCAFFPDVDRPDLNMIILNCKLKDQSISIDSRMNAKLRTLGIDLSEKGEWYNVEKISRHQDLNIIIPTDIKRDSIKVFYVSDTILVSWREKNHVVCDDNMKIKTENIGNSDTEDVIP